MTPVILKKDCQTCDLPFECTRKDFLTRKYCSRRCFFNRKDHWADKLVQKCPTCYGEIHLKYRNQVKVFCSRFCQYFYRNQEVKSKDYESLFFNGASEEDIHRFLVLSDCNFVV